VIPDLGTILPYLIGALVVLILPRLGIKLPGTLSATPVVPANPLLAVLLELLRQRLGEQRPPDPNEARVMELIRELLARGRPPETKA
jgi:hypothetical protein